MRPFQKDSKPSKWKSDKKFTGRNTGDRTYGGRDAVKSQMHQATCSVCESPCEVPFKPTGKKPILCDRCFKKDGPPDQKRFAGSRSDRPAFADRRAPRSDSQGDELRKINEKLDAILKALR